MKLNQTKTYVYQNRLCHYVTTYNGMLLMKPISEETFFLCHHDDLEERENPLKHCTDHELSAELADVLTDCYDEGNFDEICYETVFYVAKTLADRSKKKAKKQAK